MTEQRKGELAIIAEAALAGLFPVITVVSLASVGPFISLAWSTAFAALFFGVVVSIKKQWRYIRFDKYLGNTMVAAMLIGVFMYGFFFFGLKFTSPGNQSIIALTEVLFSYLLFNIWNKEHFSRSSIAGAFLMILGAAIVLLPNVHALNIGDLLVLIGVVFSPFGNFFQKKARAGIPSEVVMFIRSCVVFPCSFFLAFLFREPVQLAGFQTSWIFFAINGILILGVAKVLWLEGIHRMTVTKAVSLASFSPIVTLILAALFLKEIPTVFQIFSLVPMIGGLLLVTRVSEESKIVAN